MKRSTRVIQIKGVRGLFLTLFIICCLIAGFVVFPALLTMHIWNHLAVSTGSFPTIDFNAGVLLWAIIIFSIYLFNKRKFIVSFNSKQELTEEEVKEVVSKIKSQVINNQIITPKDFSKENTEEIKEVKADKNN